MASLGKGLQCNTQKGTTLESLDKPSNIKHTALALAFGIWKLQQPEGPSTE